jgi:uncharacterized membrane protein YhaH (DUF805 family)
MMSFSDAVRTCLREKYVTFSGRAQRSEYWWFYLFNLIVNFVLYILLFLVAGAGALSGDPSQMGGGIGAAIIGIVMIIVALGLFLPNISAVVRRLHDRNLSGWWLLGGMIVAVISVVALGTFGLIIYIGIAIAFLVLLILKGTDGPNKFGPDPLATSHADIFN